MWILIWVYKLAKKISSHFDIDGTYLLHKLIETSHVTMTKHLGSQGFCGSYAFWCCIGLKLFLRLARARKHQGLDFPEMVCYFLRFNWISARRDHLIISWTESTHKKIRNGVKLLHRIYCALGIRILWRWIKKSIGSKIKFTLFYLIQHTEKYN